MKPALVFLIGILMMVTFNSCKQNEKPSNLNIVFLHHSTGEIIWNGGPPSIFEKAVSKVSLRLVDIFSKKAQLPLLLEKYNEKYDKNYTIKEIPFPKAEPYGWVNNPYDYYNIWIKNAGEIPFMEEPTLEMLTKEYQVIIFKHCFPVSNIQADQDSADANSYHRSISNYKLQYLAIRNKLHTFPDTKFIVFTGAVQVKANIKEDEALRAREFYTWVINEWDVPDDNIYIWDLYSLQTEGGLYFLDKFAASYNDSHPNKEFALRAGNLLFNRIVDVIENKGEKTTLKGELNQ